MIFQSTLPRGERRDLASFYNISTDISIHAPTRGATESCAEKLESWKFQSTLPRGERQATHSPCTISSLISIHAPTRGATAKLEDVDPEPCNFNPRSHEGSDRINPNFVLCHVNFNPRSHEGSDRAADADAK